MALSEAHGSIHEGFDTYIKAWIKKGIINSKMNNPQLNEALLNLGIRRKKYEIDGRHYVSNTYPKIKQLNYIRDQLNKEAKQKKLEEITPIPLPYYQDKRKRYRVKKGMSIYYKNRTYKSGQLLPNGYIKEVV